MASGTTRYRKAHTAGATGAKLPDGLASMADKDPKIDAAHDAGRNGASFDDFAAEHLKSPRRDEPSAGPGSPGRSSRRGVPNPGRPSLRRPLGANVPVGSGPGTSLAGVFLGAIVYALILSVVDFGAKGPGMWFKAKFENNASAVGGTGGTAAAAGGAAVGSGGAAVGSGANATNAAVAGMTPAQKILAAQEVAAAAAGG